MWFRVAALPEAVGPGEQVTLRCSLEQLGAWGTGIPLARSAENASIWEAEVELPIGMAEEVRARPRPFLTSGAASGALYRREPPREEEGGEAEKGERTALFRSP
eukprot:SAG22_NODE_13510_length_404_cov_0.672131_1_plen_103_part_10